VAKAAMDTGVAGRPNADFAAYREKLTRFVDQSGRLMNSCSKRPRRRPSASSSPGGEDERVLRAVQIVLDGGGLRSRS
jgi:malate dehydrogenase (oxaloacetate-decarboxylating)(NADP+)